MMDISAWPSPDKERLFRYLGYNSYCSGRHKLFYVATPKVACTTLKWWFADLEGYTQELRNVTDSAETDPDLVIHDSFRKVAPEVTGLSPIELLEPLTSNAYFRFAVVRNPYKRIFSAWQSKLLLREPLQVAPYLQCDFFNHPIKRTEDIATAFEQFLEYLAESEAPSYLDVHWTPQATLLRPDLIDYSNLLRIEESKELTETLAMHLGALFVNPFASHRRNESMIPYLSEFMTERSLDLILTLYAKDFEMFGYDKRPPEVKKSFSPDQLALTLRAIALIRGRNQRLGERTGQIANLRQTVAGCEKQIEGVSREVVERDGQISKLTLVATEHESQIADLDQAGADLASRVGTLARSVAEGEEQITNLTQKLTDSERQIAVLSQDASEREEKVGSLTQAVTGGERKIANLSQAVTEREAQIGVLTRANADREELINNLTQKVAERERQIALLSQVATEREVKVGKLTQAVTEGERKIASLIQAVTDLEAQNGRLTRANADREELISNLSQNLAEGERQIANLSQAVTAREMLIGNLNHAVVEREKQVSSLTQTAIEREVQISSLTRMLAEGTHEIARLSNSEAERGVKIDNLTQTVLERDEQIAIRNKAVIERDEQIHNLNQGIAERDAAVASLNQTLAERVSEIAGLNHAVAKRNQTITALRRSHSWRVTKPLRLMSSLLRGRAWEESDLNPSDCQNSEEHFRTLPKGFDADVYLMLNPDLARAGVDPVTHYLKHGRHEGRVFTHVRPRNHIELTAARYVVGKLLAKPRRGLSALFGTKPNEFQANSANTLKQPISLVKHGLGELAQYFGEMPKGFDPDVYLKLNPDLTKAGVDPIAHFLRHGRHEGRLFSLPDVCANQELNLDLETILVVGHEASRTGAPVLTLNIVEALAKRYNVVVLLLGGGPLCDAFLHVAAAVMTVPNARGNEVLAAHIVGKLFEKFHFRFAVVNSIESRFVLPSLGHRFIPAISLFHEFASYTRPRNAFRDALFWSGEAVFSANITLESALAEYPDLGDQSFHVLPQGRCLVPLGEFDEEQLETEQKRLRGVIRPKDSVDNSIVVLGAGFVHLRKGVDLFIECAARVVHAPGGDRFRFVWIGRGYDPTDDISYSVYLADQITRAGLQEHVHFIDETAAIETAYAESDLLLLSSRLDPLPNVAIDALSNGVPVLCFDKTTGIAEFLIASGLKEHCVAAYLDSDDMAKKILALGNSQQLRTQVAKRSRETSMAYFDMNRYVDRLENLAQGACVRTEQEKVDTRAILDSGLFRRDFACPPHRQGQTIDEEVREYVRAWASGIGRRKPFPGFHPGIYLEQHGLVTNGADPFADYLRAEQPDGPWHYPVIVAGETKEKDLPGGKRIALHLHVYYPELLNEITTRLAQNRIFPDLFVSTPNEEARESVDNQLQDYKGNVISIRVVPNRGRDIGPFFTEFGHEMQYQYDYIGHIHTKMTADVKDATMGESWYRFLLENLIGGEAGAMADNILARMEADASIGMVFPDDPYAVGWDANRIFAEALARRIGVETLPEHFIFPIGTMFWARSSALAPLMNLKLDWDDYPQEPLPYDGTLLHAIERLLPLTLSVSNLRCATTNVSGLTR